MHKIASDRLMKATEALLLAAGARAGEAELIARRCVEANLAGHDSHGILQISDYIKAIRAGHMVPGAEITVVQETPTTTVIDGNWGFGYVVTQHAMQTTIEKAKKSNVAAATVFRQGHIGRLSTYTTMAANAGMFALITADSGRGPKSVAPFGGGKARLGTNPICFGVPADLDAPICFDMATSAVAFGKVRLAAARNQTIPEGWILDKAGRSATDPQKLLDGGALLPLGGSEGHKGYGLSAIIEILSGILPGLGFGVEPTGRHNDGSFMAVFNVEAFLPLDRFKREVADFARYLNATPPAEGFKEVLYPGELELRVEKERRQNGVPVEAATWERYRALAEELGVKNKALFDID